MDIALQEAIYFLCVSFAFIVSSLLFRSPTGHRPTNSLLGMAILSMGWYVMVYLLFITGLFVKVAWLAGWGTPMFYLIAPCTYLYVRQSLHGRDGLAITDWLHFLPFLISFTAMLPFNLGWVVDKTAYLQAAFKNIPHLYQQRISVIPFRLNFVLRPFIGFIYLFFQWKLLFRSETGLSKRIFRWLVALTSMITLLNGVLALLAYQGFHSGPGIYFATQYSTIIFTLFFSIFLISLLLLYYPDVLYGASIVADGGIITEGGAIAPISGALNALIPEEPVMEEPVIEEPVMEEPVMKELLKEAPVLHLTKEPRVVRERDITVHLPVIEAYIHEYRPYLHPKCSIQDMAVATRIPLHHLSYVINTHYNTRFTDLMNQYRVNHAKELIAQGAWKELSLEGLAKKSGFSNRTNFFLVFKKIMGQSPSEYLNWVKSSTQNG